MAKNRQEENEAYLRNRKALDDANDGRDAMQEVGEQLIQHIHSNPDAVREYGQVLADGLANDSVGKGVLEAFDDASAEAFRHAAARSRDGSERRMVVGSLGNYGAIGAEVRRRGQPRRTIVAVVPVTQDDALNGEIKTFSDGPSATPRQRGANESDFSRLSQVPDIGVSRGESPSDVIVQIERSRRPRPLPPPGPYR